MEIQPIRLGNILLPSNVFMAPLAGYTCFPFRQMAYKLGAGLCFTEMVSANALKYQDRATSRLLFCPEYGERIRAVQLLGGKPSVMEQMACSELLQDFQIIDINMGCPVPNVFKSGEGCALMLDMPRASAIIRGCKKSGKIITVKCRTGIQENHMFAAEFARMCEDSGADLVTIHGRSRSMMYNGIPHYDEIRQAKAAVSIPVIANGGIFSAQDADKVMEETGADGVMIGRYALENPFIFSELTGKPPEMNILQFLLYEMEITSCFYNETFTISHIRKLTANAMKKRKGTKKYKELLYRAGSAEELVEVMKMIFSGEEGFEYAFHRPLQLFLGNKK